VNKYPSRRRVTALKPDGTPDDNDRVEIGPTALAFSEWKALGLEITGLRATLRRDDARCRFVRFDLAEEFYIAIICLSL
jgi:hypothetical protein